MRVVQYLTSLFFASPRWERSYTKVYSVLICMSIQMSEAQLYVNQSLSLPYHVKTINTHIIFIRIIIGVNVCQKLDLFTDFNAYCQSLQS